MGATLQVLGLCRRISDALQGLGAPPEDELIQDQLRPAQVAD